MNEAWATSMDIIGLRPKVSWTKTKVEEEKKRIKNELGQDELKSNSQKKLQYLYKKISAHENDLSSSGQLKLFIYIMSTLVHHERNGGTINARIRNLAEYGFTILQTQGIVPMSSRLAYLYGELYLALSQLNRNSGDHWQATWLQQLSFQLSGRHAKLQEGFNALATAIRALRLGNSDVAIAQFQLAESANLSDNLFKRARIGRIQALRLAGELQEASHLAGITQQKHNLTEAETKTLDWELCLMKSFRSRDFSDLLALVRRNRSHYYAVYLLEAYFWTRAVGTLKYHSRIPTVQTMSRNKTLAVQKQGFFYQCAIVLERCYDTSYPFEIRLKNLGNQLSQTNEFISIDKELLLWAVAARWLSRNHAFALASFALSEYRALSLRLSGGVQNDILFVAEDMYEKPWFLGNWKSEKIA